MKSAPGRPLTIESELWRVKSLFPGGFGREEKEMRSRSSTRERGQALLVFVLALGVLLGFTAMAVDVGLFYENRRHLQNTADAAALAGVAELPKKPMAAKNKAADWAAKHGVPASEIKTIEVRTTDSVNDTLYVEVERDFDWIFGRVLGQGTDPVSAAAAAQIQSVNGTSNLMPWALLRGDSNCLDATDAPIPGADCSVKLGAGASAITGWYGALDLDGAGGGGAEYEENIVDGAAETKYCSVGETDPACEAFQVDALSGNKVGGTDHAIADRLLNEPTCDADGNSKDDFVEVFVAGEGDAAASYAIACPQSPRVIFIPIVSLDGIPVQTVTIEGWALAYLNGYSCSDTDCAGGKGHWEVDITMVDAIYSQSADLIGAYNPLSKVAVRSLIE
jgi:Flp pilus assembly protein TadG